RTLSFFFQAEDGIRDFHVTGVQTCALPISLNMVYNRVHDQVDKLSKQRQQSAFEQLGVNAEQQTALLEPILLEKNNIADKREDRSEERRVGKEGRHEVKAES